MSVTVERVRLGSILQDVSFQLAPGTITLLIGQTGAGKSSLLDVLTGLNRFDAGAVRYDDVPLWDGKRVRGEVLQKIGVVFQFPEHQLFARTVQGEFDYSLQPLRLRKAEASARTLKALREVGLPDEMSAQSPLLLSGGQKRRVALATTIATAPQWLFLDEPTAGLDPQAGQQLVEFLLAYKKQTSGGIVIATHDFDAFFPIADRVLLLDHGRLLADTTPSLLCQNPHLLTQARVGLPSSTVLSQALASRGLKLAPLPVPPEQMADQILASLAELKATKSTLSDAPSASATTRLPSDGTDGSASVQADRQSAAAVALDFEPSAPELAPTTPPRSCAAQLGAVIRALDPRAKWAFYLLVSLGVLIQSRWLGLAVATGVTMLGMWSAAMWKREVWRMIKPFLYLLLFSVLLSGLRFGAEVSYDWAAALQTLRQLYKFLLLMLLGIWLSTTTSQLLMKQGLETVLAPLKKFRLPVEAFALATSLLLRFVPVILQELRRFSRITQARGKSVGGKFRLRDTRAIVVPLLLSVLRLGEDLSLAMEARGYAQFGKPRTTAVKLRLQREDRVLLLLGGLLFAMLLFVRTF